MATLRQLIVRIEGKTDKLRASLTKGRAMVDGFAKKLVPLGNAIKTGIAGLGVASIGLATAAFAKLGSAVWDASRQMQAGQGLIQTSLGVTGERAKELGDIALNVWKNNFGESIEDVNNVLIKTSQQLGDLADSDLQYATQQTIALRDAFGWDVDKSLNATKALMDNFGLSATQAYDFLVAGQQKGLNASDDFLDSITEYGSIFSDADASADQFFSLMETGLGTGVLGTDKITDGLKEFQIRFLEGNKDLKSGFQDLGLNYDEFRQQVDSGKMSITDVFGAVIDRAKDVDMSLSSNKAAVAKLGTQFEDMGAGTFTSLSLVSTSMDDIAGSVTDLDAQYNNLQSVSEGLWRRIVVAIMPVTDELLRLANMAMPYVEDFFNRAQPIIDNFSSTLSSTLQPALQIIGESLTRISIAFGWVNEDASMSDVLLSGLQTTLNLTVTAVQAIAVGFYLLADAIEWVTTKFSEGLDGWKKFGGALNVAGDFIFGTGNTPELPSPKAPSAPAIERNASTEAGIIDLQQAIQELSQNIQNQPIQIETTLDGEKVANNVARRVGSQLANRRTSRVGSY